MHLRNCREFLVSSWKVCKIYWMNCLRVSLLVLRFLSLRYCMLCFHEYTNVVLSTLSFHVVLAFSLYIFWSQNVPKWNSKALLYKLLEGGAVTRISRRLPDDIQNDWSRSLSICLKRRYRMCLQASCGASLKVKETIFVREKTNHGHWGCHWSQQELSTLDLARLVFVPVEVYI